VVAVPEDVDTVVDTVPADPVVGVVVDSEAVASDFDVEVRADDIGIVVVVDIGIDDGIDAVVAVEVDLASAVDGFVAVVVLRVLTLEPTG
jgi:hypothetical protein